MLARQRQAVMLMVPLRMAVGGELRVRLSDISKGGAKIRSQFAVPAGSRVTIELPALGWVPATVVWVGSGAFGLRFAAEIDPSAARQAITGDFAQPKSSPPPKTTAI